MVIMRFRRVLVVILVSCTAIAPTLTACGGGGPGAMDVPTTTPPAAAGLLHPSAFLTLDPAYTTAMLWTLDYHQLAVFPEVEWADPGPATAVVASTLPDPAKGLVFAFLDRGLRTTSLIRLAGGERQSVQSFQAPTGIAGSLPAGFALVGDYAQGAAGLYLIDLRTSESAAASDRVWRQVGPLAVPIAVRLDGHRPVEILFGMAEEPTPAGLGSTPLFGLQSLWLETGVATSRVAPEILFLGISPDLAWYAVSDPSTTPPQLEIRRYDGSASVVFPPQSGSRALGRAVFSPEARFVAWSVSLPSEEDPLGTMISIASTSGGVPLSLAADQLAFEDRTRVQHAVPVAWLDEQTLLLQVEVEGQPQVAQMRSDGSGLRMAGRGVFVSLVYR